MPTATECPTQVNALQTSMTDINTKIQALSDQLKAEAEADGNRLKEEAPQGAENSVGLEFKIEWVDKEYSLHIPTVTMENQVVGSLHLPEIRMSTKDIVFHSPSVRMVDKVMGQYPEIVCHGLRCETRMKDIIMSVPETFTQEQRISLGIPEVIMTQQDLIMGVPVFGMTPHTFILSMPKITAVTLSQASHELNQKADEMNKKYEAKSEELKGQIKQIIIDHIVPPHIELFQCIRSSVEVMRTAAASGFDQTLIPIEASINDLKARSVPADNEQLKQLEADLNDLTQKRDQAIQIYDTQLTQIDNQKTTSLEQITTQIMQQ